MADASTDGGIAITHITRSSVLNFIADNTVFFRRHLKGFGNASPSFTFSSSVRRAE
ncbi:MAG: hypothetical protein LBI65_03765 [Candidatus Symbiothrix sp.]|nr:hypothetical protein [Candidatus Symbiothrix sp.]